MSDAPLSLGLEEVERLPLRFMVALAARSAIRVMPLTERASNFGWWRNDATYHAQSIDSATLVAVGFAVARTRVPTDAAFAAVQAVETVDTAASQLVAVQQATRAAKFAAAAANDAHYAGRFTRSAASAAVDAAAAYDDNRSARVIVEQANRADWQALIELQQGQPGNRDEIVPETFLRRPLWPDESPPDGWEDLLAGWRDALSDIGCSRTHERHLRMIKGGGIEWGRAEPDVVEWYEEYQRRAATQQRGTSDAVESAAAMESQTGVAANPTITRDQSAGKEAVVEPLVPSTTAADEVDALIDAALTRQLVVTTFDRTDVDSARQLFAADSVEWRFGPPVTAGDFVLVYFPQRIDVPPEGADAKLKPDGFRLLFRAIEESHAAPEVARWRQEGRIAHRLELEPVRFSLLRDDPVLREWGQGGQIMTRLGRQEEPLDSKTSRAFWKLLVDTNGERILEYLRRHLLDASSPSQEGTSPAIPASIRDEPATVDLLGREPLVKSLAAMFASREQGTPFTVGLLGDWGAGKSSVLNLVKQELERYVRKRSKRANSNNPGATAAGGNQSATPREAMQFCFAQFNAWEYEKTQNVSAGLAQEVVKGLISGVGWREHSWLQFRFAWSEGAWQFKALFVVAALLLIGGAATAHAWVPLLARNAWRLMGAADGAGALTKPAESSVILILVLLTTYLTAKVKTVLDHPLTVQLDTYLKLPDYGQHLGLIPILKRQIRTLFTCGSAARGKSG